MTSQMNHLNDLLPSNNNNNNDPSGVGKPPPAVVEDLVGSSHADDDDDDRPTTTTGSSNNTTSSNAADDVRRMEPANPTTTTTTNLLDKTTSSLPLSSSSSLHRPAGPHQQRHQYSLQPQSQPTLEECLYGPSGTPIVPEMTMASLLLSSSTNPAIAANSATDKTNQEEERLVSATTQEARQEQQRQERQFRKQSEPEQQPETVVDSLLAYREDDDPNHDDSDDEDDVVSLEPPHVIDLTLLRRIVSLSGILEHNNHHHHSTSRPPERAMKSGGDSKSSSDDDDDDNNNNIHPDHHPEQHSGGGGGGGHRAVTWRVLMGLVPPNTADWHAVLANQRQLYVQLATDNFHHTTDLTVRAAELVASSSPSRTGSRRRRRQQQPKRTTTTTPDDNEESSSSHTNNEDRIEEEQEGPLDHPNDSTLVIPDCLQQHWKKQGRDLVQLERLMHHDWNALRMDHLLSLQTTPTPTTTTSTTTTTSRTAQLDDFVESALLLDEIRKDVVRTHPDMAFFLHPHRHLGPRRYAALERILFVWSKYNKGVRYVQGMNEIVGILYYVLAHDDNLAWGAWAEADTYWLFHILLTEMSDVFVPGLDNMDTGITGRIDAMKQLLQRHDPEVVEHLTELGVEMSFFAIRWWTTLLSREFLLPDTIRLWDSMFASTHKDNFLRYMCVTMILSMRDLLLKSDFSAALRHLHAFPSHHSMEELLNASRALWVYESQVNVACHRGGLSLHQALNAIQSPPALIFAFGFPKGTPPASRSEQLEMAKRVAEERARSAAKVLGSATRGFFSGIKSLGSANNSNHNNYNNINGSSHSSTSGSGGGRATIKASAASIRKSFARATSMDSALALGRGSSDHQRHEEDEIVSHSNSEDDDIYLKAFRHNSH